MGKIHLASSRYEGRDIPRVRNEGGRVKKTGHEFMLRIYLLVISKCIFSIDREGRHGETRCVGSANYGLPSKGEEGAGGDIKFGIRGGITI